MSRPLQNRVTPDGRIVATPERGTLMGNRGGRLHDGTRSLGRARWRSRAWIACVLSFRGRQRTVMGDSYTELFFLDEATALAAGHRPCFECRRADAQRFATLFGGTRDRTRAAAMDAVLHAQRTAARPTAPAASLPDGAIFTHEGHPFLAHRGQAQAWRFAGYAAPIPLPDADVTVITPAAICAILAQGYRPALHPSARA